MKRKLLGLAATLIAVVLPFTFASAASARPTRIDVSAYATVCGAIPGRTWTQGPFQHGRNFIAKDPNTSENPWLTGLNTVRTNWDANQNTGDALWWGTWSFQPNGIAGTWEGVWYNVVHPGTASGKAFGHGTGVLKGKAIVLNLLETPPNPDTAKLCEGIGQYLGNGLQVGYILSL